jgi:hypothetical protein
VYLTLQIHNEGETQAIRLRTGQSKTTHGKQARPLRASGPDAERPRMSEKIPAAPGLALEVILPHLDIFSIAEAVWKFLQQDLDSRRREFWCRQIAYVSDAAESPIISRPAFKLW